MPAVHAVPEGEVPLASGEMPLYGQDRAKPGAGTVLVAEPFPWGPAAMAVQLVSLQTGTHMASGSKPW